LPRKRESTKRFHDGHSGHDDRLHCRQEIASVLAPAGASLHISASPRREAARGTLALQNRKAISIGRLLRFRSAGVPSRPAPPVARCALASCLRVFVAEGVPSCLRDEIRQSG
jgi:hypothetical protein